MSTKHYVPLIALACLLSWGGLRALAEEGPSRAEWTWPSDLSAAEIAALRPLRDRYLARLDALGPGEGERLQAIAVDAATRLEIREAIHDFSYRQQQGSAAAIRAGRRDALIARYGVRAVPFLCEALGSERYWSARLSAQALRILAEGPQGDEVRWLALHADAPGDLIQMFDWGPELELLGLHQDLDAALRALLQVDPQVTLSDEASVEEALQEGRRARKTWNEEWREIRARWRARQRAEARERRQLERKLDLLLRGVNPEQDATR